MSDKDHFVSARVTQEEKESFQKLHSRFGFSDFSKFLSALLGGLSEKYDSEGWRCQMLCVRGNKLFVLDSDGSEGAPLETAAFKVVAPDAFWRYVESQAGD